MSESQQAIKLAQAVTYREATRKKAELLLEQLLVPFCDTHKNSIALHVLVIGAGAFPSYIPLLTVLRNRMQFLQSVHLTLVEPVAAETSFFQSHFEDLAKEKNNLPEITISIFNREIKDFLRSPEKKYFDLIYFEHPETMTLPIVLAKLGIKRFKQSISLRESFPYLANVISPAAWIIASCMSHHELSQAKSLLSFSLQIDSCKVRSRFVNYFYGGPYCSGLVCHAKSYAFGDEEKRAEYIHRSDNNLFAVLVLSFVIYCFKFSKPYFLIEQILAIAIMYIQLLFHRPGIGGLLLKIFLLAALVVV